MSEKFSKNEKSEKDYKRERFEFTLMVNDFIICRRNFRIHNFIEHSMDTLDFKLKVDDIVNLIDNDLKSKSRVWLWYQCDSKEQTTDEELTKPLQKEGKCLFKLVVSDWGTPVITKAWDGSVYPKAVRDRVDLANKNVRIVTRDGKACFYAKEDFFGDPERYLTFDQEVLKAQIMDKQDILREIIKQICECCSTRKGNYEDINDYTISEKYGDTVYPYDTWVRDQKEMRKIEKKLNKKTRDYFINL